MVQIKKGGAHGLYKVVAQLVGSDGISYGIAGDSLAQGSISTPRVLDYPKESGVPTPDRSTIDFTGGDRWITSYQYGLTSLGNFDFSLQDMDTDFIAMCNGTSVDQTTNTEWTMYTEDHLASERPQLSLMFIWRIQSFETSTFGNTFYLQTIVPRCWVHPRGPQGGPSFQSAASYSFQVTPASSSRMITGSLFDSNLGATDNKVALYHIISSNPLGMATMVADGASISVVAAHRPISSAVGSANATKTFITLYEPDTDTVTEGVADSVNTSTGAIAVGTAVTPAADDIVTAFFETAYVAV